MAVSSDRPFSARRARRDLVNAMPALGMVVGAVAGAVAGATQGSAGTVTGGGLGIAGGLVVGLVGRWLFRQEEQS